MSVADVGRTRILVANAHALWATRREAATRRRIATLQERQGHESAKADEVAEEIAGARRRSVELAELVAGLERAGRALLIAPLFEPAKAS